MLQINWDLNSTLLGAVLHKHLPRDTYTVWKLGTHLRIDGHLKGMREDSKTLLPNWKYGHFSILLNTAKDERMALYVNHDRKTYTVMEVSSCFVISVCMLLMKHVCEHDSCAVQVLGKVDDMDSKDGNMDAHILLAHSDVKRARVKFSNFKFNPVRGWLTSEVHETVGGLQTTVFVLSSRLLPVINDHAILRLGSEII